MGFLLFVNIPMATPTTDIRMERDQFGVDRVKTSYGPL